MHSKLIALFYLMLLGSTPFAQDDQMHPTVNNTVTWNRWRERSFNVTESERRQTIQAREAMANEYRGMLNGLHTSQDFARVPEKDQKRIQRSWEKRYIQAVAIRELIERKEVEQGYLDESEQKTLYGMKKQEERYRDQLKNVIGVDANKDDEGQRRDINAFKYNLVEKSKAARGVQGIGMGRSVIAPRNTNSTCPTCPTCEDCAQREVQLKNQISGRLADARLDYSDFRINGDDVRAMFFGSFSTLGLTDALYNVWADYRDGYISFSTAVSDTDSEVAFTYAEEGDYLDYWLDIDFSASKIVHGNPATSPAARPCATLIGLIAAAPSALAKSVFEALVPSSTQEVPENLSSLAGLAEAKAQHDAFLYAGLGGDLDPYSSDSFGSSTTVTTPTHHSNVTQSAGRELSIF